VQDEFPTLTTGQRIKVLRTRSGKTRAVLGGLVGKSAEWVKSVEMGRILPPRIHMLNQIARALRSRSRWARSLPASRWRGGSSAYETAPETIRYNLYARQMVVELINGPSTLRRDANDLAIKVGLAG